MYFGQAVPVRQDISASVLGMGIPNSVTSHLAPTYDTGLLAYAKTLLGSKNFDNHDLSAGKDNACVPVNVHLLLCMFLHYGGPATTSVTRVCRASPYEGHRLRMSANSASLPPCVPAQGLNKRVPPCTWTP
jgi:hypothetical protein